MKILLLGGNGQLGQELRASLPALGTLLVATRDGKHADVAVDLADTDTLMRRLQAISPDVVVNAAAYTAVDRAQAEPDTAFRVNALGPAALSQACAGLGALLVHYSTDYVFDGNSRQPYREQDATAPMGAYGASKLAGEEFIRASGARHLILRTAWVYAAHGHNFLRTMLKLAGERDVLRVVSDQVGAPTPASWIADATAAMLRREFRGSTVCNVVAAGQTSWHGFAEAIFEEAQALGLIANKPTVEAITTADYPTPARRPAYSVLDTTKLRKVFRIVPPAWRDGLRATLQTLASRSSS